MTVEFYILRAVSEGITKIGVTSDLNTRVSTISNLEKAKYCLVFKSERIDEYDGRALEKTVSKHFSHDIVKGKEWFKTHPLDIIRFVIPLLGFDRSTKKPFNIPEYIKYPAWIEKNSKYNTLKEKRTDGVRIDSRYTAYVQFVYNHGFRTVAFCNIGDAARFARKNKHAIKMVSYVTEILYGQTKQQWTLEKSSEYPLSDWALL